MKALVNRLSDAISTRYVNYLETFMVDLWSSDGLIEFRCGFSLRSDHVLQSLVVKLPAASGTSDAEREALTIAVFEELETQIDLAIASDRVAAN